MESKKNLFLKILVFINILLVVTLIKIPTGYGTDQMPGLNNEFLSSMPQKDQVSICYFNREELYDKLKYMEDIEESLSKQMGEIEAQIEAKTREIETWESKWPDPHERLPSEKRMFEQQAVVYQQEYELLLQQSQMELQAKEIELMTELARKTEKAAEKFALENDFDFVLSHELGGSICYGSKKYDITGQLIQSMNKDYKDK